MGWWAIIKATKELYDPNKQPLPMDESELLNIGDQPMDIIESALKKVSRLYKKDLKRKPTPDELTELLESSIRIHEEDLFDDMEERELESAVVKLKQRPRRPRPKPGDFFAIPLPSGGYGYGRIKDVCLRWIVLVDFLDIFSLSIKELQDISNAKVLVEALCGSTALLQGDWPVIGNIPVVEVTTSGKTERQRLDEYNTRHTVSRGADAARNWLEESLAKGHRRTMEEYES